ncbi:MAG TPA: aminomethyl-transferring glycine dehydrogenase subunit GcvPB [Bacillota bacterium]|nr:aminomethyl-transferring glycine dehydrogenase subunit GcvPB [Bacillota bacterium]
MRKNAEPVLLKERSVQGRRGYLPPVSDLPSTPGAELIPSFCRRQTPLNLPELSEMEVTRHFIHLAQRSFGVDQGFYPLGSCTMKYNPKLLEELPRLSGFQDLHPLQDESDLQGALAIIDLAEKVFATITGMDAFTLQPAAGAHGELTGLLILKAALKDRGEAHRDLILIPDSAHGTNPASAALAGFQVQKIPSSANGILDPEMLKPFLSPRVAGLMLTNPNTLGLFEENILTITQMIHGIGGQVYYDGANLNAIMGWARPGDMGFDLVHLNLHKTFATPHGGGGPGSGPLGVKVHLAPYLPVPRVVRTEEGFKWDYNAPRSIGKVKGFWGHFAVIIKALAYLLSLGYTGLKQVSTDAVLAANYLQTQLKEDYNLPYDRPCMHEFVLSGLKENPAEIRALDLAKALLDYGVHPPTIYFPLIVSEALMIEPTEAVTLELLDSFVAIMKDLAEKAKTVPETLKEAPYTTPVRRLNETEAARHPVLKW